MSGGGLLALGLLLSLVLSALGWWVQGRLTSRERERAVMVAAQHRLRGLRSLGGEDPYWILPCSRNAITRP